MASLQQTSTCLQSKLLPSSRLPRALPSLNLSFSATFPSLKLSTTRPLNGGTKMSATAASSYAVALADVAKSNNTLDSTCADIEKVEKIFSDPQVLDFFANPVVDVTKKRQVLNDIAKGEALQPHVANFLNILVDSKRIDIFEEIVKEFELVYNKLTNTELAVVSSVVKLESQHLAQIAKQVQKLTGAKNVRIKTVIDPSLVAGFTIRYGNSGSKLIDMSVKKQLEEIAAQLDLGDIQLAV
ncbi:ATPase, F1 complex, OSCP/delta subunit [Corchorus olitorius]|uniref:ATPase, F1 complex, OSCP/delta subunit n=1 Tax=Corchorus olitorius TaxID=93759 RepID=A0A1R3JCY5_9ROSI|nr:ATPase, F1 complex, OSCP/delta subunit [Corchorus olitorius]